MSFTFESLPLHGAVRISSKEYRDSRGLFFEGYKRSSFVSAGIRERFVQDNSSISDKHVLRGLHYQTGASQQGKLVSVIHGAAWDVCVDLRPASQTFGQWHGELLDATRRTLLYVPPGFAHGFVALSDQTVFQYKCTAEYDPAREAGILWNDPELAIAWPTPSPILSEKDAQLPTLSCALLGGSVR